MGMIHVHKLKIMVENEYNLLYNNNDTMVFKYEVAHVHIKEFF